MQITSIMQQRGAKWEKWVIAPERGAKWGQQTA